MEPLERMEIVFYFVTDWERARSFYGETLGLKMAFTMDGEWAEYETGSDVRLAIHRIAEGQEVTRGGATVVFGVSDAHAARAELEARGVEFQGEIHEMPGTVRLGTFLDPDGNVLQIAEDLTA